MECLELSLASCGPQPAKPWAPPVTPELPTYHEAMSPSTIWYLWRRYCAPKPRCQLSPRDLARSTLNVRSEEHTSELQSLMRISYAVFCLTKKNEHKIRQIQLESNI